MQLVFITCHVTFLETRNPKFVVWSPFSVIFEAKRAAITDALFNIVEFERSIPLPWHAFHQQRSNIHNDQRRENEQPEFSPAGAGAEVGKPQEWLRQQMEG